jgi:hypothetical protein
MAKWRAGRAVLSQTAGRGRVRWRLVTNQRARRDTALAYFGPDCPHATAGWLEADSRRAEPSALHVKCCDELNCSLIVRKYHYSTVSCGLLFRLHGVDENYS